MQISKSAPLFSLHELYNPSSSLIQTFKLLAFFCDYTGRFVSELVANPEDRLSHVTAQISYCENLVDWGLTSHQQLRLYGELTLVYSSIRRTDWTPGLQGEWHNHCTTEASL